MKRLIRALLMLIIIPIFFTVSLFFIAQALQPDDLPAMAISESDTIYIDTNQKYNLAGSMLFYPGVVLSESDFSNINSVGTYNLFKQNLNDTLKVRVSSSLSDIHSEDALVNEYYDGTFLFTLKLSGIYQYGMILPEGICNTSVYINGKLCSTSVKSNGKTYMPYSQFAEFPDSEYGYYVVMITVHTPANYIVDMSDTILFGTKDVTSRIYHNLRLSVIVLISFIGFCFIFFTVHNMAMDFFKPLKFFTLLLVGYLITILTQDCGALYELYSIVPYEFGLVLQGLAEPIFMVLMVLLSNAMFPAEVPKRLWLILLGVQVIPLINVLCLGQFHVLTLASNMVQVIPYALCLYVFVLSYDKKEKHSLLYGISVLLIESGSLLFYATRAFPVPVLFASTFGIALLTVMQVIILSSKYSEQAKIEKFFQEELTAKLAEKQASENAFLNAQMKPHFLYNTLNTIADCCVTDSGKAKKLINSLSEYLKLILSLDNMEETVPLSRELELATAYSAIEKERFPSINFYQDFPYKLPDINLPPITIQPLIENAIKHGVRKLDKPGVITLRIVVEDRYVNFFVSDNGTGMTPDTIERLFQRPQENKSIGIYTIDKRLKNLYGESEGLNVESTPGLGTCVSFSIPKKD